MTDSLLEFTPALRAKHHIVKLASGKWTRTLGAPGDTETHRVVHVRGREWKQVPRDAETAREWWQAGPSVQHATKKSPAQLQREINEALTRRGSHASKKNGALPVRDDVTEVEYHRPPTASEIRFGEGATHYRTFPVEEAVVPGTRVLRKWFVASDDGLRYYR